MIKIIKIKVGSYSTNCYLVYDNKTRKSLIIDPGDDYEYIYNTIYTKNIKPLKIIATHGHFDHVLVAYEIQKSFNIPFCINKKDEFILKTIKYSAKHYSKINAIIPPKVDYYLKDSDYVLLGRVRFKVIEIPGHTPGSIALHNKQYKLLFSGDLIFAGGSTGRYDFKYSDKVNLHSSIKKILQFDRKTTVYSGHGSKFTLEEYNLKYVDTFR